MLEDSESLVDGDRVMPVGLQPRVSAPEIRNQTIIYLFKPFIINIALSSDKR